MFYINMIFEYIEKKLNSSLYHILQDFIQKWFTAMFGLNKSAKDLNISDVKVSTVLTSL